MSKDDNKFTYPDCWKDDKRMDVLFSPFRLKAVNEESYMSKLMFWKDMIRRYCVHNGAAEFNLPEIKSAFERKNKMPYCLPNVIDDMLVNKEIRLKEQFMYDPLDGWSSWAVQSFIKKPFKWAVQKMVYTDISDNNPSYVHLDLIKTKSYELLKVLSARAGRVVVIENILTELEVLKLSDKGLEMCLGYLHALKKVFVEKDIQENGSKITLVKIPLEQTIPAVPMTPTEKSILKLESTERNIIDQMNTIEDQIKVLDEQCRQYIREGKKMMAKNCLKKKHMLQSTFVKRATALDNIQTMIDKLRESEHTKPIVDAYQIGNKALKNALENKDLNLNKVDELMIDIKETLETNDEMQQTLQSFQVNDTSHDAELEAELDELLATDNDKNDKKDIDNQIELTEVEKPTDKEIEDDLFRRLQNLSVISTSPSEAESLNIKTS